MAQKSQQRHRDLAAHLRLVPMPAMPKTAVKCLIKTAKKLPWHHKKRRRLTHLRHKRCSTKMNALKRITTSSTLLSKLILETRCHHWLIKRAEHHWKRLQVRSLTWSKVQYLRAISTNFSMSSVLSRLSSLVLIQFLKCAEWLAIFSIWPFARLRILLRSMELHALSMASTRTIAQSACNSARSPHREATHAIATRSQDAWTNCLHPSRETCRPTYAPF